MKAKFFIIWSIGLFLASCGNDGRGYEYMPDMYRSPSLETYGKNNVFSDSLNARKPVKGTIARGYLTTFNFGSSQEDYLLSGKKAINPYDANEKNSERLKIRTGKDILNTYPTCHYFLKYYIYVSCYHFW